MSLAVEVSKYRVQLMNGNNVAKFIYLHLTLDHLKSKLKEIIGRDIDTFES